MPGKGEVYKRADGKWAFRVKASNGQIVATDGGQGYGSKSVARSTLERLLKGGYDGPITEPADTGAVNDATKASPKKAAPTMVGATREPMARQVARRLQSAAR